MTGTMPAYAFHAADVRGTLTRRPTPTVTNPDDVLVRVTMTGICGTDRAILLGEAEAAPGVVLGHEAVGRVAAVGAAVRGLRGGARVVVNPTYYCTACRMCRRGRMALCRAKEGREIGVDRDGTMARYAVVPERFVHPIPDGLPDRRAALVEPLACVLNNLRCAAPRWDDDILVLGGGPIGALCALVLAFRGFRVRLTEPDQRRAALVREALPRSVDVTAVPDLARPPDLVVDSVGTMPGVGVELVEDGATVLVMGERLGSVADISLHRLATGAIRVVGAGPYAPADFESALDLAADLPLESLVSHEIPLHHADKAMAMLGVPDPLDGYAALKILLTVPATDG
ncbi:zinc-dependent alcohol dehydrogenase [Micromonospora schwarzwaldensis]|uniref:zinc-dependent alcohol dehydrogenase n=1 Tax=Micromonospora sp. DSM 45708 TaxID=3111767 RepID=UPI0031E42C94